jgi:lipid A 3-O-deacylase
VRPAIPGNGYFYIPDNEISWSGFVGAEGRAIAHNIFLDGNTFENSPSVDKNIGVLDLNAGVTLSYGQSQISYTLNWRSKEFDDQNNDSVFGAISIGYRF